MKWLALPLFAGFLAQNALAAPPAPETPPAPPPHLANPANPANPATPAPPPKPAAAPLLPHNAAPIPPHLMPAGMRDAPHIKGIHQEIFLGASLEKQISALQIDSDSKARERANSQKFRDERHKLELEKKILQVKLLHATDEKARQDLLSELYQSEQAIMRNKFSERELKDQEEIQRLDAVYKALR